MKVIVKEIFMTLGTFWPLTFAFALYIYHKSFSRNKQLKIYVLLIFMKWR